MSQTIVNMEMRHLQSYPSCNQEMEGANLISGQEVSLDQSMNGNPG